MFGTYNILEKHNSYNILIWSYVLCVNVLAPHLVKAQLKYIKDNNVYYPVTTDASNKSSIVSPYFNYGYGIIYCLLDFYEGSQETAAAITNQIKNKPVSFDLNLKKLSAFTAVLSMVSTTVSFRN